MAAFRAQKQFKTAVAVAASSAQSMDSTGFPLSSNVLNRQARVYAKGADLVIKFGDSSVAASATVTSGAYADGNVQVPAGTLEVFDLGKNDTHYSVISDDGVSTGNAWVNVGYGEGKPV